MVLPEKRSASNYILENVEAIAALYEKAEKRAGRHQYLLERLRRALGRPWTLYILILLSMGWIAGNALAPLLGIREVDPPPFAWLQGVIGFLALLFGVLILITQNHQGKLDDQRAHIDLQVNLLAEKKIAKLIDLLEELRRDLPMVKTRHDAEAEAMKQPTDPVVVAKAVERKPGRL